MLNISFKGYERHSQERKSVPGVPRVAVWIISLLFIVALSQAFAPSQSASAQSGSPEPRFPHSSPLGEPFRWRYQPGPLSCFNRCQNDLTKEYPGCDDKHCYARDPNFPHSFGLTPRRSYTIVYSENDRVCREIRDALNWALRQTDDALSAIWEKSPDGLTANPIFSSDIFLRWHRLDYPPPGPPVFWWPILGWMVVPFLNDGVPRLVTSTGPELWQYAPQEIDQGRWENLKDYDQSRKAKDKENPLSHVTHYINRALPPAPEPWNAPANYRFPRLPHEFWESPIWKHSDRWQGGHEVQFAGIDDRYYFVSLDGSHDTLYVADISKSPGEDICYLQSSFSRWLVDGRPRIRHQPVK